MSAVVNWPRPHKSSTSIVEIESVKVHRILVRCEDTLCTTSLSVNSPGGSLVQCALDQGQRTSINSACFSAGNCLKNSLKPDGSLKMTRQSFTVPTERKNGSDKLEKSSGEPPMPPTSDNTSVFMFVVWAN